ncbi:MAG: hypothetical protein HYR60_30370 [Acidobacteria bacterium]|nr:hypothetical protein [Acidobacteriota bacterium]MBI3470387.1 hypothetical protein [Candidatus Solibacter usitatus]
MESRVLFVSPYRPDVAHLAAMIEDSVEHVTCLTEARNQLQTGHFAVVLTEAALDDGTWHDVLRVVGQVSPATQVVVTDSFATDRLWAEALSYGAYDLLVQPFQQAEVRRILSSAASHPARARATGA